MFPTSSTPVILCRPAGTKYITPFTEYSLRSAMLMESYDAGAVTVCDNTGEIIERHSIPSHLVGIVSFKRYWDLRSWKNPNNVFGKLLEWVQKSASDVKFVGLIASVMNVKSHLIGRMINNIYDREGRTALHFAALLGEASILEFLVRVGGNPVIKDNQGNTPLHYACKRHLNAKVNLGNERYACAQYLIYILSAEKMMLENKEGQTPLDVFYKHQYQSKHPLSERILDILSRENEQKCNTSAAIIATINTRKHQIICEEEDVEMSCE